MDVPIVHENKSLKAECLLCTCGLSFYARDRTPVGMHPDNAFHLAATARTVYAEDEDMEGFRTGAYFISLHPNDRSKLAECITQKNKDEAGLQEYQLPETFKPE